MADPFTDYVDEYDKLCGEIETANKFLKPLKDRELKMRKAIVASIQNALPNGLREGLNEYQMIDGRVLKLTIKVKREVDEAELQGAREEFEKQNDTGGVAFDDVFTVKYAIDKRELDKVDEASPAYMILARVIVETPATPTVVIS